MNVLVAGFGSELQGDDAVGLHVVRAVAAAELDGVRCIEAANGGVILVHELYSGWDRLVVVDGVRNGCAPGTVHVTRPDVPDPAALPRAERVALQVDAHLAEPSRALLLARALGVLPADVHLVGIEVGDTEEPLAMTPSVAAAVHEAAARAIALAR